MTTSQPSHPSFTLDDLHWLNRELSALLKAGVSLPDGLRDGVAAAQGAGQAAVAQALAEALQQGQPLSQALRQAHPSMPPAYVALVEAGEASGRVTEVLEACVLEFQRSRRIHAMLGEAFAYPVALMALVLVMLAVIFLLVVPQISGLTALEPRMGALMVLAQVAQPNGLSTILGGVCLVAAVWLYSTFSSVAGRARLEGVVLRSPGFRHLHQLYVSSQFLRLSGHLVGVGLPAPLALELAAPLVHDARHGRTRLIEASAALAQGRPFAEAIGLTQLLHPGLIPALERAERAGQLGPMLLLLAEEQEERFDLQRQSVFGMLEPVLTLWVGVFVGLVLVGVYLPLFRLPMILVGA